jgi:hypothetical protein
VFDMGYTTIEFSTLVYDGKFYMCISDEVNDCTQLRYSLEYIEYVETYW